LFESRDAANISRIYRINADGSGERQLFSYKNAPLNEVRLSPNGRYILFTSPGASISEIYTVDLATRIVYKIPSGPEAKNYNPTWSPDSSRIAYSSTFFKNGRYYSSIRVSGAKGENTANLAVSNCYATPLTWSPDSRRIAYLSGCREEIPPVEVWSIDLRKPFPINILSGFLFYALDWATTR
jgi:TolB protein